MHTVTSRDGSKIAYDRSGDGPTVILVGGALSFREFSKMTELAELLSARTTVINYDRRGRGDSTETTPFSHATAVQREVEDIAALIEAEGGKASLWGWSSGGALALEAAKAGIGVERVSVYEVPVPGRPLARPADARLRGAARRARRGRRPQRRWSSTSCGTRSGSRRRSSPACD